MVDQITPDKEDDLIAPVKGALLNRMIRSILRNRWSTGWGLISEKGAAGGIISLDPYVLPDMSAPAPLWAQITSVVVAGDNRWQYAISEAEYLKDGLWQVKVDGFTGYAYNTIETPNAATGVQGNGVDVSNLPNGVAIAPLGIGAVTRVYEVVNCETGGIEYVFHDTNQVDGTCS